MNCNTFHHVMPLKVDVVYLITILHSGKFELETQFVLEFLANNNILNRNFITNLGSILHRNPACGQVCILPRNLPIVQV